jgi:hypothetical protein
MPRYVMNMHGVVEAAGCDGTKVTWLPSNKVRPSLRVGSNVWNELASVVWDVAPSRTLRAVGPNSKGSPVVATRTTVPDVRFGGQLRAGGGAVRQVLLAPFLTALSTPAH